MNTKRRKGFKLIWGWMALFLMLTGCSGERVRTGPGEPVTPSALPPAAPATQAAQNQKGVLITKYPGNYTCFKFETAEGVIILTDPYNMNETVRADIVTTSHKDFDHADFSRIEGTYQLDDTTGTHTFRGITITGVAGHHNRYDTTTSNIIYVFEMDGLRLAQFASQGERPTEAMYAAIGNVDILIIQIYGAEQKKLDAQEAAQIAQRLQARIVIPAHTDTSQNDRLAAWLTTEKSQKITSGQLFVTQASLAGQDKPRVIVLDTP